MGCREISDAHSEQYRPGVTAERIRVPARPLRMIGHHEIQFEPGWERYARSSRRLIRLLDGAFGVSSGDSYTTALLAR